MGGDWASVVRVRVRVWVWVWVWGVFRDFSLLLQPDAICDVEETGGREAVGFIWSATKGEASEELFVKYYLIESSNFTAIWGERGVVGREGGREGRRERGGMDGWMDGWG